MNSVRPNNLSLKYQRFTLSGWKENLSLSQKLSSFEPQFRYKHTDYTAAYDQTKV